MPYFKQGNFLYHSDVRLQNTSANARLRAEAVSGSFRRNFEFYASAVLRADVAMKQATWHWFVRRTDRPTCRSHRADSAAAAASACGALELGDSRTCGAL
jgi:hypothetical protein